MDLRIAIGPQPAPFAVEAVRAGGATVVDPGPSVDGLVWLSAHDVDGLRHALAAGSYRWVQLPFAGVEQIAAGGLFDHGRFDHGLVWTSAKGAYAEPVAEHALALALAGLRHLPERITARSWGAPKATTLFDADVVILGGGGITATLLRLLAPYRVRSTVVRRTATPVDGASRTVGADQLHDVLPGALVVFLALALTPATEKVIDRRALADMDETAWLVNVARGGHVDTDALVAALRRRSIAGAALDVTEPEPLPDGHPLWTEPNCIITPHTADTQEMVEPLLARRIRANVAHLLAGEDLEGIVDVIAGY